MGTGIDHSPGRTCSTGGITLRAQASFCTVPVTATTPGTVHVEEVRPEDRRIHHAPSDGHCPDDTRRGNDLVVGANP